MEMPVSSLWDDALAALRSEMDQESFATWLKPTVQHSYDESTLVVGVPDAMSRNWLCSHYKDRIAAVVERLAARPVDVAFEVQAKPKSAAAAQLVAVKPSNETFRSARLNEQYTFDAFVVGESNRFAHAAARAVADMHTKAYNPLFIYGGVGLGKTHLMHAIGHELLKVHSGGTVLYVSSEQFMNSFIDSVRQSNALDFRNYYRTVDLLLIDDVQFFIGKEATQTEFFHTFNALYDEGKKIVVTSDAPPKELNHIDERLKSRFEWGLIVDIQAPDLETRVAILQAKARLHRLDLPYDQAMFIAERIKTNVRKLEGVITQLKAHQAFSGGKLSIDELNKFLTPHLVGEDTRLVSAERVCNVVCEFFDVEWSDIKGKSRMRKHTLPRHVAMYLCRQVARLSFPDIGGHFGSRDHTSVMHACRKIEEQVNRETNMQNMVTYMTREILESRA